MYIQKNSAANMFCKQEVELAGQGVAGEFYVGQVLTCSGYIKLPAGKVIQLVSQFREQSAGGDTVTDLPVTDISIGNGDWQYFEKTWAVSASPSSLSRAYEINFSTSNDPTAEEVYLTGIQLEMGQQATPYEDIPVAEVIALCQRYCRVVTISRYQNLGICRGNGTDTVVTPSSPVPKMRTTPTATPVSINVRMQRLRNSAELDGQSVTVVAALSGNDLFYYGIKGLSSPWQISDEPYYVSVDNIPSTPLKCIMEAEI
jgi:hypothetical protein